MLADRRVTALAITLTRWPTVHLLPADKFYQLLTTHGINMLIFWIIFFEIAVLYFCSSTLSAVPPGHAETGLAGAFLMVRARDQQHVGVQRNSIGDDDVLRAHAGRAHVLPGLILFAVGALIGCFIFLGTLVIAKEEKTYEGSIPLVTFGALTACIIAIFTICDGRRDPDPDLPVVGRADRQHRCGHVPLIWWGFGHSRSRSTWRPRVGLVCHCGHRVWRQAVV